MTRKSPAFQFYPADFLSDLNVIVMSAAETGAYALLMSVCWIENSLPDDITELAAVSKMGDSFADSWGKRIKRCFVLREDGRWDHPRLQAEREKQQAFSEKMSAAANRRHHPSKPKQSRGNANAVPRHQVGNALQSSSISKLHSQSARARELLPAQFQGDFDELIERVPNATAWSAEIASAPEKLNGAPGKAPTPAQIGQAIRDYNANSETPNLAHFRGYLRRATAEPRGGSVRSSKKNGGPQQYDYPNLTDNPEDVKWQT